MIVCLYECGKFRRMLVSFVVGCWNVIVYGVCLCVVCN